MRIPPPAAAGNETRVLFFCLRPYALRLLPCALRYELLSPCTFRLEPLAFCFNNEQESRAEMTPYLAYSLKLCIFSPIISLRFLNRLKSAIIKKIKGLGRNCHDGVTV